MAKADKKDGEHGDYIPINDVKSHELEPFDKPLPCCGCGLGWCSFLLGFVFPLMWYFAAILYFGSYYHRDPRERTGLAASAIAAVIFTFAALLTLVVLLVTSPS
ncbi:hypothetical protein Droror1_Dr00013476 [Drosera rotundifolia]